MRREFHPIATFRGLRYVPLVAVSRNSLYPKLEMDAETLTIRVVGRNVLAITDIEMVDVKWRLAHQVTFVPRKGPWTFSANFSDKASAREVLAALAPLGVPLTAEARAFLETETP